ncbi:MAG: radical SAM protein [Paracoccaceae bacterium]
MSGSLNLIIKTTRKCNLRCSYCHDWRARGRPMDFEVLASLTAKALHHKNQRVVNFIWHGGEPFLLGMDFFKKAMSLQERFLQPGQYVINSIQTNGTLLTPEWCDFLKRNKFTVGVSIDGPEKLHNQNRSYASGLGSFQDIKKNIDMLKEYDIGFGILMVLNDNTKSLTPKEIFDFIVHDLGVNNFSFLPAVPDNIPGEATGESQATDFFPMEDYADFMKGIFDYWFALDDPDVKIREIEGLMRSAMGGNPQVCTLAGNCIGENFHIEASGDVYHCDKYVGLAEYNLGNIIEHDFQDIKESQKIQGLVALEERRVTKLKQCSNFKMCNGGCPHDRFIADKYDKGFNGKCCGQFDLIEHIKVKISANVPVPLENPVADTVVAATL